MKEPQPPDDAHAGEEPEQVARARALHAEAERLSAAGDEDAAIDQYRASLAVDPSRSAAWKAVGIAIAGQDGPIDMDFGLTPVRLEPDGEAEVVWARRIDPVRARIESIPFPGSRFRYRDVVLHDGAAVGYRLDGQGNEKGVFNVFELLEPSEHVTFELQIEAPTEGDVAALEQACDTAGIAFEDWTANVQTLCKACSEGRPHEEHDGHTPDEAQGWMPSRRVAVAAVDAKAVRTIASDWAKRLSGRQVMEIRGHPR